VNFSNNCRRSIKSWGKCDSALKSVKQKSYISLNKKNNYLKRIKKLHLHLRGVKACTAYTSPILFGSMGIRSMGKIIIIKSLKTTVNIGDSK
jgi:hypothetical protein